MTNLGFRVYDVRGIHPTMLNEHIALKIGKASGTFNPEKIVGGDDAQLSGSSSKEKLTKGLI